MWTLLKPFRKATGAAAGYSCIHYTPGLIADDGAVTNDGTEAFLRKYMQELRAFIARVLTVLPRGS